MSAHKLTGDEESALYDAYRFSDDAVRLADVAQQIADRAFAAGQAAIADELDAQAEALERRVMYHGLGPHGVCPRCEAWTLAAGDLRRRAAAIRDEVLTDLS